MPSPILLCTDGSDETGRALSAGLDLLGRDHDFVLVTVMNAPDEASLAGSGHAGPDMSLEEYDAQVARADDEATSLIAATPNVNSPSSALRSASFEATQARRFAGWQTTCRHEPSSSAPEAEG